MTAAIIEGTPAAFELAAVLAQELERLHADGIEPALATVRVGEDLAAAAYERRLAQLCRELGVPHAALTLPSDAEQDELCAQLERLNHDPATSGILVLRPLPEQIDEAAVFAAIDPAKDIEAVHPANAGLLALGTPRFVPSTAAAVFHLLDRWLEQEGETLEDFYHRSLIVVVGRSGNVGKPCVSLGYARQAAVASVDEWASRSGRLGFHTRRADVLIVAAGVPGLIRAEHVGPGAIVMDVGINLVPDEHERMQMVGDVDLASLREWARAVTPVPGGVGPLTDVWLLGNTVLAAQDQAGRERSLSTGLAPLSLR